MCHLETVLHLIPNQLHLMVCMKTKISVPVEVILSMKIPHLGQMFSRTLIQAAVEMI